MIPDELEILARPVGHLPLVRAVIDDLGLLDVIDKHCPRHTLNRVSDAECVMAMLLNVLCGRPALYRMDQWLGRLDVDVLFGEGAEADAFHDTRLGEARRWCTNRSSTRVCDAGWPMRASASPS